MMTLARLILSMSLVMMGMFQRARAAAFRDDE
jgi:hypothetical protein